MNQCLFTGNVAHDLELKRTKDDVSFMRFKLAVSKSFKKADGTFGEEVVFPQFEIWDSGAENLYNRAQKGTRILVDCAYKEVEILKEDVPTKVTKFRVNSFEVLTRAKEKASA